MIIILRFVIQSTLTKLNWKESKGYTRNTGKKHFVSFALYLLCWQFFFLRLYPPLYLPSNIPLYSLSWPFFLVTTRRIKVSFFGSFLCHQVTLHNLTVFNIRMFIYGNNTVNLYESHSKVVAKMMNNKWRKGEWPPGSNLASFHS